MPSWEGLVPVSISNSFRVQTTGDGEVGAAGRHRKVHAKMGGRGAHEVVCLGPVLNISAAHCFLGNCILQFSLLRGSLNEELAKSGAAWKFEEHNCCRDEN